MSRYLWSRLWVIAMLIVCITTAAVAQNDYNPQPCVPDCPSDVFSTPVVTVVTLPSGCQVNVTWAARYAACVNQYDVAILNIETITPTACALISDPVIMRQVTNQLIISNPMGFPPTGPGPECVNNWRVTRQACWNSAPFPNPITGPNRRLYPCSMGNVCCLQAYEVCYDPGTGQRTVRPGVVTPGDCGVVTNPNCLYLCQ